MAISFIYYRDKFLTKTVKLAKTSLVSLSFCVGQWHTVSNSYVNRSETLDSFVYKANMASSLKSDLCNPHQGQLIPKPQPWYHFSHRSREIMLHYSTTLLSKTFSLCYIFIINFCHWFLIKVIMFNQCFFVKFKMQWYFVAYYSEVGATTSNNIIQ